VYLSPRERIFASCEKFEAVKANAYHEVRQTADFVATVRLARGAR
jgi:hypothetical protein